METMKQTLANSMHFFKYEQNFSKLTAMIKENSEDLDKLRIEYLKEVQEKKTFFKLSKRSELTSFFEVFQPIARIKGKHQGFLSDSSFVEGREGGLRERTK